MRETLSFPGLGLEFELSRVAFSIGSITVYWYGVLIAAAFLAGTFYALRRSKTFGVNADRAVDVIMFSAVGGVIGARIYYVLFSWDYYSKHLDEILKIWHGGIAIYGGVIGALLTALLVCKLRHVKFLPMADMAMGGILLGQAIGRWGNFVNIEAFGSNTDLPWGMTSPSIVSYLAGMVEELEKLGVKIDPTAPVHPTFFYESVWCLIGFGLAAFLASRRRFDGELLLFYTGWYGAGRFVIEGLRTDSLMLGTIRISQLLAACCVIAAAIIWIVVRSKIKSANDPEYLKVYAKTEEAALVVSGEYYQQLAAAKKAEKEAKAARKQTPGAEQAPDSEKAEKDIEETEVTESSDAQDSGAMSQDNSPESVTKELIETVKSAAEEDIPLENPGKDTRYPGAFSELVPLDDALEGVQGSEDVKYLDEKREKKAAAKAAVNKLPVAEDVKELIETVKTAAEEDIPLENPGEDTRYPGAFSELVPLNDEMEGVQGTEDVQDVIEREQRGGSYFGSENFAVSGELQEMMHRVREEEAVQQAKAEAERARVKELPVSENVKELIETAKTAAEEDIPLENPGKDTRYPGAFSELVPLDDEMAGVQGSVDVKKPSDPKENAGK